MPPPFAYGASHALTKASIYPTCNLSGTGASARTASLDVFRRMPRKADEYWAFARSLTPRLTGAGARSAQGTNTGHKNAEGMAAVGVHVELTVRLWRGVEGLHSISTCSFECCASRVNPRAWWKKNITCFDWCDYGNETQWVFARASDAMHLASFGYDNIA